MNDDLSTTELEQPRLDPDKSYNRNPPKDDCENPMVWFLVFVALTTSLAALYVVW